MCTDRLILKILSLVLCKCSTFDNWIRKSDDFLKNSITLINMVIIQCTFDFQKCMIHHFNQRVTADVKMYHTWLYVNCTMIYDHICIQFWRSVSASEHGNMILKQLTRPTRVRSPDPKRDLWTPMCQIGMFKNF